MFGDNNRWGLPHCSLIKRWLGAGCWEVGAEGGATLLPSAHIGRRAGSSSATSLCTELDRPTPFRPPLASR